MWHPVIDITFLTNELKRKRPPHGLPRVILAYLEHYLESMHVMYRVRQRMFIIPKPLSRRIGILLLQWDFKSYRKIMLLLIEGMLKSDRLKSDKYILFKLDQNGMKYPNYFNAIKRLELKLFIVIHDLFPIDYPEYSDPNYALQFAKNIQSSVEHADGLICVSNSTRQSLVNYINSLQAMHKNFEPATEEKDTPPMTIASLAAGLASPIAKSKPPLQCPYFVILSTIVARKNHLLLLQIWRKLVDKMGENTPKLVIIGKRSSECTSTLALLDRCQSIREFVVELQASDEELAHYLAHAKALLFPTFAEGYGLPLMEALSYQVPVIASDLPIFHEIAGDIPDYLDPLDGLGWMRLIVAYCVENGLERHAQLQRLQGFQMPAWSNHFEAVTRFVDVVLTPSGSGHLSKTDCHSNME